LFLSTLINGLTVGILWAAANTFVASCASEESKGFFFGYFWSFYMTSQIFGNLIAAIVLGHYNQASYFTLMAILAGVATVGFAFV
jgi:MFS family permease